jgi:hypothetical protein
MHLDDGYAIGMRHTPQSGEAINQTTKHRTKRHIVSGESAIKRPIASGD